MLQAGSLRSPEQNSPALIACYQKKREILFREYGVPR